MAFLEPTITMSNSSGTPKRRLLAERFHIHTVLTCHDPQQANLSENTGINESIVIARRKREGDQSTRFVVIDRFPSNESEVEDLHRAIVRAGEGPIGAGWGEVCGWPAVRMEEGDWTPGAWRSREIASANRRYVDEPMLNTLRETGLRSRLTKIGRSSGHRRVGPNDPGAFPILGSSGEGAQLRINGVPDEYFAREVGCKAAGTMDSVDSALKHAGFLLVTQGQNAKSGRLTAVAVDVAMVGNGWQPVPDVTFDNAKALAVFFNSTPGRIQLMSNAHRTLGWPQYLPVTVANIRIPDPNDAAKMRILANCWEQTKDTLVPQFGEGECEVRQIWDDAVADAMGWDAAELTRLRLLLHKEPHVSGRRYGHYGA